MADYIERKTVLNALSVFNDRVHGNEHFLNGIETAKEIVDKTLSADVAPVVHVEWKHVKWVKDDEEQAGGYWISRCSNCIMPYHSETPYCPHCGAKMDLVI